VLDALRERSDLRIVRASSAAQAAERLRERGIALLVASPDLETGAVTALLASRERLLPAVPVLVVRHRQAEEPAEWVQRGVGVLRCPLLPGALNRSVDVVLGLSSEERAMRTRTDGGTDRGRRG
jgi:hypothetical protein